MGEFVGQVVGNNGGQQLLGMQVRPTGNDNFEAVSFIGGLPGEEKHDRDGTKACRQAIRKLSCSFRRTLGRIRRTGALHADRQHGQKTWPTKESASFQSDAGREAAEGCGRLV